MSKKISSQAQVWQSGLPKHETHWHTLFSCRDAVTTSLQGNGVLTSVFRAGHSQINDPPAGPQPPLFQGMMNLRETLRCWKRLAARSRSRRRSIPKWRNLDMSGSCSRVRETWSRRSAAASADTQPVRCGEERTEPKGVTLHLLVNLRSCPGDRDVWAYLLGLLLLRPDPTPPEKAQLFVNNSSEIIICADTLQSDLLKLFPLDCEHVWESQ